MSGAALATNNASTTLLSSLNLTDTTLVVAAGTGALFPSPTGGDYFFLTLANLAGEEEIVTVVTRNADTMTLGQRGADGTAARVWLPGDAAQLRIVAGAFNAAMAWAKLAGVAGGLAPLDSNTKLTNSFLYIGGTTGLVVLVAGKVPLSQLPAGTANGLATLDAGGKVPFAQLPPLEYLPIIGGTITGSLGVDGDLTVGMDTQLTGALEVGGPGTFLNGVMISTTSEGPALDVMGNAEIQTELVVGNTIQAGNTVTAPMHLGVMKPSAATPGTIAALQYSTSAPSGAPPVADGAWWIQYEN